MLVLIFYLVKKLYFFFNLKVSLQPTPPTRQTQTVCDGPILFVTDRYCVWQTQTVCDSRIFFKASTLWADAFYKSKCPSVCLSKIAAQKKFFSLIFFTFEVPFNGLFAPTSRSWMSNIFRDSESLGKSNGKKWSNIWTFLFGSGLKSLILPWSTLLRDRCYYPHRSRDALSPVCGIFFANRRKSYSCTSTDNIQV